MRIELLFGFLGSGKTTLARRILEEWGVNEQLGLIVNEFGDVGVDGDILRGNDIDILELSSGCLCCTLKGSMLNAIEEMAAAKPLDHLVIEATGVAEPEQMLETFADPAIRERFPLGPITTVVNAAKFEKIRWALGPFFDAQISQADLLILNKVDLADAATLEETREEVRELNPEARIRFAEHCDIDIAEIMHGPPSSVARKYGFDPNRVIHRIGEAPGGAHHHGHGDGGGHDHDHEHHDHDHHHAPAESFVIDAPGPVSRASLASFFAAVPEGLWRAKGFLQTDEGPTTVQFAMGDLDLTGASDRERYYLVMIGNDLDEDALAARFRELCTEVPVS